LLDEDDEIRSRRGESLPFSGSRMMRPPPTTTIHNRSRESRSTTRMMIHYHEVDDKIDLGYGREKD